MATDTAPRPRRMYWQLPVFALGVTAAVLAWRYFPQNGMADTRSVEQDRFTLRQAIARRPVNVAEVQSLLDKLGDDGTRANGDSEVAYAQGSAFLLLAEQGPPEQAADHWKKAHALFAECDGTKLADKQDRARLAFRSAKASAGAGVGDPAVLIPQLELVPAGEDPGERSRLLAEACLKLTPPNTKRAKAELSGYLSGPPRGTPEQAAKLKLSLADLCAATSEPDKARTWLKEIGDGVPTVLQAEAKLRLARLALGDGDVNEAVKLFQSADALPNLPAAMQATVRYETGRGLMFLNNPTAAKESLAKAAETHTPAGVAANVRLAEMTAREFDPSGAVAHLEAALKNVRTASDWNNPHVQLAEVRGACETTIKMCQSLGKFAAAARAADVYSPIADASRDRELWAEVTAAWGQANNDAEKLKAAAAEFGKLADTRPDAEKTGFLQKSAAAYQLAGDPAAAAKVLGQSPAPPGAPTDAEAGRQYQLAVALIDQNKLDDAVKVLGDVANAGGPVGTRATLRLALLYAAEGKKAVAAKPTDPAARKQVEYAVTLLTQLANKTYTSADERLCHQEALYELGKLQLSKETLPWLYNCSDAETRFRRLVTEYPAGDFADRGTMFLGITLSELARPDGGAGVPPSDATAKLTEAKKLFESLGTSKNDFVRTQADIRQVHTALYLKDYDGTVSTGKALADKYRGEVAELILLNIVSSAHAATQRPDLAKAVLERMQQAFADMPDAKFTGNMREYTRAYWVKELDRSKKK